MKAREGTCGWCLKYPEYIRYHEEEWGVLDYEDQALWEKLILDGAQAGLSWWTILSKRDNYRKAFDNFDPEKVARYDQAKQDELMQNAGIVRNKLKIKAAITNAQSFIKVVEQHGSFKNYIWGFVDGQPIVNRPKILADVPATSDESDIMSKQLKKDGFKFVGSTIVYAYMQAVGMVNDHLVGCPRHQEIIKSY